MMSVKQGMMLGGLTSLILALGMACGVCAEYEEAQLAQGSLLLETKQYSEAVAPLEAVVGAKLTGDLAVKALGQLAICYARTSQLDKAKKAYEELGSTYAEHALMLPTTRQLAEAALDAGDKAWADKLFAAIAEKSPSADDRTRGLSGLAWTQFKSGQLEAAAGTFDRVLKTSAEPALAAEAALVRGEILEKLNRPDAALAMFDLVIEKYAKTDRYAEALWAAARLRDDLEQDRQAVELYQRLVETCPKFAQMDAVLYRQAWAMADLGQADKSQATFERLRREYPQSRYWADVTFRLAQRAFESKNYARAEELVGTVLQRKPDQAIRENAMYLRGQIAMATDKWPQAREAFEGLVKAYPGSSLRLLAEYGTAEAVFRQGNHVEAVRQLEQLSRQIQGRREGWMAIIPLRLAQSLCYEKRWDDAYEVASKIEAGCPGFDRQFEVDYVLGRCQANRGDFEQAREAYRRVIRSSSGAKTETAAKAQLMIGESYLHQKNYEAAIGEFLRVESLYAYPALQAAAVMQTAKCHELLGQRAEAVKLYERLLSVYPKSEFTADATARLQSLRPRTAGRAR